MEVVGGVASIITLIEATGVLAEVSKNLVLRWKNAPHEIQALATRLSLLAAELQSIKNATARSHPVLTDAIIRQSLSDLLTDVRKRLTKLESLHFRLEQHSPLRQKLQWTVKDAGSAEKMLNKTQEIEQRLANLMTLISLRAQTPILDGIDRIEQMVSTLVVALPASAPAAPATSPNLTTDTTGKPLTLASKSTLVISSRTTGKGWEDLGVRGAIITTQEGYHTDYNITFSISLPLAQILGSYALTGCLSLRSTPLCRNYLTFRHPSYFAVARVVDRHHPFMLACQNGDLETVRFMLRSGEGRPTDRDIFGSTPIYFAARAGKTEVVAELLECGIDVEEIVGLSHMSTMLYVASQHKQLDLVRFLLQRGASTDHLDSSGFGASAVCWVESDDITKHSSKDVYHVLSEGAFIDLYSDPDHYKHAVSFAALGACGSQIDFLIGIGHKYSHELDPVSVMGFAAENGNFQSYSALLSHLGGGVFQDSSDIFTHLLGRTILGKSLYSVPYLSGTGQYDEILRDLLQRCGDGRILPLPSEWHPSLPPSVATSKEMKSNELAATLGPEIEAWYLSMVCSCGFLSAYEENKVVQRLRELRSIGHITTGFVDESEGVSDDSGGDRGCGSEDWSDHYALAEEGILENSNTDGDGSHESNSGSEADEADQFWDAPESV